MDTLETGVKAEEVRKLIESMDRGIRAECQYHDAPRSPASTDAEEWRLEERDRYYRYQLRDSIGTMEVRVTFDAMRFSGVTAVASRVLDAWRRREKEPGRRGFWVAIKPMNPG
jgi:hypothetical protein